MIGRSQTRREFGAGLIGVTALGALGRSTTAAGQVRGGEVGSSVTVDARPAPLELRLQETAVLVVDMQNDFGAAGGMFHRAGIDISSIRAVVPAVQRVLAAARHALLPIVYLKMAFAPDLSDAGSPDAPNLIKHGPLNVGARVAAPDGRPSRILIRDTWNTDIIPELAPRPEDIVLYKTRYSGFFNTPLHDLLQQRSIRNLIVTGCTTSVCVESTVRDAMFRDYRCLLLEDCTAEPIAADAPRTNHEASLLTMQILFAWISDSLKLENALART